MKILYFSQFYNPESIAPSFRATENSQLWVDKGNEVTVFTGYPNYPTGKIFDGYDPKILSFEDIDGVRVVRSKLVAKPNTSVVRRLENALSFFVFGLFNIIFNKKKIGENYDVVLGTSGVIFTALLAQIYSMIYKVPFVFEIRDITYVQMQATGKKSSSISVKIMKNMELFLCSKAQKVVVVTNGFKKILMEEGVPESKIEVITNGVDVQVASGVYDNDSKFTLSYFGTLGISQNIMETFCYGETISKIVDDFEYLIIGEGAQKEKISAFLKENDEKHIKMLPGMTSIELEEYYKCTQMSVITLRKSENFQYTIPSKLFQIMGRGIAVLFIGPDGETAEIIRKNDVGLALTGTVNEDIKVLNEFFSGENWRERLRTMGQNGRRTVENYYSRKKLAEKYIEVLNEARKNDFKKNKQVI